MSLKSLSLGLALLPALLPGAALAFDCKDGAVTIGIARAKTGGFAFFDDAGRKGITIAVDQINDQGGIDGCPIRLVEGDTQSNPALAAQVADELIAGGARIIMAPADFDMGVGASLSAQKAGLFAFSPEASSDAWTKAVGPDFVTGGTIISDIAKATAGFANQQGWKGAYVVTNPAFNYFTQQEPIFTAAFTGTIVGRDDAADDAADYAPIITKIRNAGDAVDVIFLNDYFPHVGTFIKQLRAAGLKTPVIGSGSYSSAALPEVVGAEGIQDVYYVSTAYYEGAGADPGVEAFLAAYGETFGGAPDNANALLSYYSGLILADALKTAGSTDAAAISAAIAAQKDLALPGVTIYGWQDRYPRTSQTVIGFTPEGAFRPVETIDARTIE
jgi:branched-chain amino acid transport system substrate-binding protein